MQTLISWVEKGVIPDPFIKMGISALVSSRLKEQQKIYRHSPNSYETDFMKSLGEQPIAIETDAANEQHYEVPPEFFVEVLGDNLKYSGCFYETGERTLSEAENTMLKKYCEKAQLKDGMEVLDLGCGWGSLTFYIAKKLSPTAKLPQYQTPVAKKYSLTKKPNDLAMKILK